MKIVLHFIFFISTATFGQSSADTVKQPGVRPLVDSATLLIRKGNIEKALFMYEKIVSIDSTSVVLYLVKEDLEGLLKKYDRAVLTAVRLTELRPDEPLYQLKAGALYERIGDTLSGRKFLDKAIFQCDVILDSLKPNDTLRSFYKLFKALAIFLRGNEVLGNTLFEEIYREQGASPASGAFRYMNKSKVDLLKAWFDEK